MEAKWKYNKEKHQVDEQPRMKQPTEQDEEIAIHTGAQHAFIHNQKRWVEHCENLLHYPVSGEVDWKNGEDVTNKFELRYNYPLGYKEGWQTVAIPIKQEQPHPEYNKKICAIAVSEVLSHEQKLKEIDLLIAEYYPIRQDADNPAWEEVDKGFDKLEGFKHDKPTEQEVKAVETDDELWEAVVNITISTYSKWLVNGGKGDFGETELKKKFTIKRIKT